MKWVKQICDNKVIADRYIDEVKKTRKKLLISLYNKGIKFIPSQSNWFHINESDLPKLPQKTEFKKNCIIPNMGSNWVRLQITDNIGDYNWILK